MLDGGMGEMARSRLVPTYRTESAVISAEKWNRRMEVLPPLLLVADLVAKESRAGRFNAAAGKHKGRGCRIESLTRSRGVGSLGVDDDGLTLALTTLNPLGCHAFDARLLWLLFRGLGLEHCLSFSLDLVECLLRVEVRNWNIKVIVCASSVIVDDTWKN